MRYGRGMVDDTDDSAWIVDRIHQALHEAYMARAAAEDLADQVLAQATLRLAEALLADAPDDHDWAALRHRRCSRLVAGEGRVGRVVCDDNVTTDDLSAGQGVVSGLAGCAGCRTFPGRGGHRVAPGRVIAPGCVTGVAPA